MFEFNKMQYLGFLPLLDNMELIWSELDGVGSGYFNHVHQQNVLQPEQKSINLW